ncbi:MAG: polysaccharide biosynthesis/export family protein, partial [Gammaproteobacteria bacterium]
MMNRLNLYSKNQTTASRVQRRVCERVMVCVMSLLLMLFASVQAAQADSNGKTKKMPPEFSQSDNTYVIGVDDKVSVSVWRNADLSLTVPVRPDGRISTPLVGDVVAAGKTP